MKRQIAIISVSLLAVFMFVSCKGKEDAGVKDENKEVFFPENKISYDFNEDADGKYVVTVERNGSKGEHTESMNVSGAGEIFEAPSSVHFANGQTETTFTVTFDKSKFTYDKPYTLSLVFSGRTDHPSSTLRLTMTLKGPYFPEPVFDYIFRADDPADFDVMIHRGLEGPEKSFTIKKSGVASAVDLFTVPGSFVFPADVTEVPVRVTINKSAFEPNVTKEVKLKLIGEESEGTYKNLTLRATLRGPEYDAWFKEPEYLWYFDAFSVPEYTLPVYRSIQGRPEKFELTVDDPSGKFTVPEEVSFSDGLTEAGIGISLDPAGMTPGWTSYPVKFTIPDNADPGRITTTTVNFRYGFLWSDPIRGTYELDVFERASWEQTFLEAVEFRNDLNTGYYRFPSLHADGTYLEFRTDAIDGIPGMPHVITFDLPIAPDGPAGSGLYYFNTGAKLAGDTTGNNVIALIDASLCSVDIVARKVVIRAYYYVPDGQVVGWRDGVFTWPQRE